MKLQADNTGGLLTRREVRDLDKTLRAIYNDPAAGRVNQNRVRRIKEIISTRLSVPDRTLILLYAEYQSYRKLGEQLGLSHMTVRREILRIRKIILDEYERLDNDD